MRKVDLFFVLIIMIFAGLGTAYVAFDYHLSGVEFQKQKVNILKRRNAQLQLQNEALELKLAPGAATRGIASIKPSQKEISLDELYKNQLTIAKANKKANSILRISDKIINSSVDASLLAEAHFEKAVVQCHLSFREDRCLQQIEAIVTQFPETVWAGESLVLLSEVYTKLKRFKEAESVIKIVRAEFSYDKNIISKVDKLQKNEL